MFHKWWISKYSIHVVPLKVYVRLFQNVHTIHAIIARCIVEAVAKTRKAQNSNWWDQ